MNSALGYVAKASAKWLCTFVVFGLCFAATRANEYRITVDFKDVLAAVEQSVDAIGPSQMLLVVDIDNTILSMNESLGSEQWFDWQEYLLKNEPHSDHLVATSFDGLLDVQGILFDRGTMRPTQPDLPKIIQSIQHRGVACVVLTSRGDEFRAATERELVRNGFDFASTALPVRDPSASTYLPFNPAEPDKSGLTDSDVATTPPSGPHTVSYFHGIMMTSGQNKGVMLTTLLSRSTRKITSVVYVDNRADHCATVFSQMMRQGIDTTAFTYQRENDQIRAFQYGSKNEVHDAWIKLDQFRKNEGTRTAIDARALRIRPTKHVDARRGCCSSMNVYSDCDESPQCSKALSKRMQMR